MGAEGVLPQLGFVLVVCSLVPMAASVVSFGHRAHRSGSAGPWFARGTTVSAVLIVVASVSVVVPMFVLAGWVILTATRVGRSSTILAAEPV